MSHFRDFGGGLISKEKSFELQDALVERGTFLRYVDAERNFSLDDYDEDDFPVDVAARVTSLFVFVLLLRGRIRRRCCDRWRDLTVDLRRQRKNFLSNIARAKDRAASRKARVFHRKLAAEAMKAWDRELGIPEPKWPLVPVDEALAIAKRWRRTAVRR